jgi:hypothetical protein
VESLAVSHDLEREGDGREEEGKSLEKKGSHLEREGVKGSKRVSGGSRSASKAAGGGRSGTGAARGGCLLSVRASQIFRRGLGELLLYLQVGEGYSFLKWVVVESDAIGGNE